jgi:D-alanyl-D-alanine carboxypeptidase
MEERIEELIKQVWEYRCLPCYRENNDKRYTRYKLSHNELSWEEVITHVEIGLDLAFYSKVSRISYPNRFTVLVNKYRQLSRDYIPGDLEMIAPDYNESTLLLRHSAREYFEVMCCDARKEGIILKAISTFRSFLYQNQVYYKNWNEDVPLLQYQAERDKVSARAGHSEHQTGLAVDINDLEETFADTPEGIWLADHSYKYGFILRYPKGKEYITGYNYEPWHFRYIGTLLAEKLYQSGLSYDEFFVRFLREIEQ